jgi:hypothetical protein
MLDAQTSIWFKREERAYTPDEMRVIVDEVDEALERWGIRYSTILSDHAHEFGHTALPYLRERGIRYKLNIAMPDEANYGLHEDWRPAPYGSMCYALDRQPISGLFVVFNHFSPHEQSWTYLDDGRHTYLNRGGGVGPYKWDFLNGLTRSTSIDGANDLEQAAQRLAMHTARGLDSLFFGGSITHSRFARDLSPEDWDWLLDRFDQLTAQHQKRYASYDAICAYAESKVNTHIQSVDVRADGSLACTLTGEATVPLELSCFTKRERGVERCFVELPAFCGQTSTVVPESALRGG